MKEKGKKKTEDVKCCFTKQQKVTEDKVSPKTTWNEIILCQIILRTFADSNRKRTTNHLD